MRGGRRQGALGAPGSAFQRCRGQKAVYISYPFAYASTTIPATFSARLNGVDITSLFHPQPGTFETVQLVFLQPGRNVLVLSIDGTVSSGRVATDTDRLVFIVQ